MGNTSSLSEISKAQLSANTTLSGDNVYKKQYEEYGYTSTTLNTFFNNRFEYISKYLAEYIEINPNVLNISVKTTKPIIFNSLTINEDYDGLYFEKHTIKINFNGNNYKLTDLKVIEQKDGYQILEIIGTNPKIEIL